MEQEKTLQFLTPNGYKEFKTLQQLADSLHDIEVGKKWLRGKSGSMPFAAFPAEASTEVT